MLYEDKYISQEQSQVSKIRDEIRSSSILLRIEENQTCLKTLDNDEQSWSLPLGSTSLAERYLQNGMLTEQEIESLITAIEEAITPLSKDIAFRNRKLLTENIWDGVFRTNSGEENSIYISNSDLEQVFVVNTGRLMGRLSYMDIKPLPNNSIVSLTILREIVHHLYFDGVYLLQDNHFNPLKK